MSKEELQNKHEDVINSSSDELYEDLAIEATNITLSFCIGVLKGLEKELHFSKEVRSGKVINNKIQELEKLIEK